MFSVSLPGKVILMGEHAVVYGKPAFVTAVNRRMMVSIEPKSSEQVSDKKNTRSAYIRHIIGICEEELHETFGNLIRLHISSDIPSGYHLGSSGSLAMGIVGAIFLYKKIPFDKEKMIALAGKAEHFIHGTSSGIDPTIAFFGGYLRYQKNPDGTRRMDPLHMMIPKQLDHFFLIDTGKPKESTGDMVASVAIRMKNDKFLMEKYMDENERQTMRMVSAFEKGNERELIGAINAGESTLEGIGVVSEKVKPCMREIENCGGAVKILGGGGKVGGVGYMLCYHTDHTIVGEVVKRFGYSITSVCLGQEGLRIEKRE